MSDERRKLEANRQESAHEESHDQSAEASASNEEPTPQIIECFAKVSSGFNGLFEWLSLQDLLALRQTCTRFKQEVDNITTETSFKLKVKITNKNIDQFRNFDSNFTKLIKQIDFRVFLLKNEQINDFKGILGRIEVLQIKSWQIRDDFHETLFQFCPNVKRLTLEGFREEAEIIGTSNDWLRREYPKLEHFDYDVKTIFEYPPPIVPELKTFFELNRNIHTFSTAGSVLWRNQEWLLGSNIQFDILGITEGSNRDKVCGLVRTLHRQGFYKRLHFHGHDINEDAWNAIAELPAVEKLYLTNFEVPFISRLISCVKELGVSNGGSEWLARNFMNVERVFFKRSEIHDILSCVRHSARVTEIRVDVLIEWLHFEPYFTEGVIDLPSLNKERANLAGACKQTIYVPENIYLATKCAGMPMECPLVELKRLANCEWKPFFTF